MKYSIIIPIYKNEGSILQLLEVLSSINQTLEGKLEAVFVVDGSPDKSFELLKKNIDQVNFQAQILLLSRNFGSFAAIQTGLNSATGDHFGVMAADLQEPPELLISFFESLSNDECDVVVGVRKSRQDPFMSRLASSIFWSIYRHWIVQEMPVGGVDIFGCNRLFRDNLVQLEESRSSLIALIFWVGFRRKFLPYERKIRIAGKSAWTFKKKLEYMMDSIFAFTDYPISLLINIGAAGLVLSVMMTFVVLLANFFGEIAVPGYTATVLFVLFFGALNLFGLGLVGTYSWRAYENSKRRPNAIVALKYQNKEIKVK